MKSLVAALAVAFVLGIAGTASGEALNGDPSVVAYPATSQDLRSPDAASAGVATASGSGAERSDGIVTSGDGLAAVSIVLIATAGAVTFAGAAYTLRRGVHARRHTAA